MPDKISIRVLNARDVLRRLSKIKGKIKNTALLLRGAASFYLREVFLTFRKEGAHAGNKKWRPFAQSTLHPSVKRGGRAAGFNRGKWNIRYGTDLRGQSPRRRAGVRIRRYSPTSKLLQASGQFRNSFHILSVSSTQAQIGTRHKLAQEIMNGRPVITPMTQPQRAHLARLMQRWTGDAIAR